MSLVDFLKETWDRLVENNQIIGDENLEGNIWLVFTGDKGGPSTKIVLFFANLETE